jgi:glycosyltransferase involved in cell wall biosynthesis
MTLLVHDFAFDFGGAERVTAALAEAFPDARVLAVGGKDEVIDEMGLVGRMDTILPKGRFAGTYRWLSPALPRIVRRTVDEPVISSSYAFAHHVRSRSLHVEYCHSPVRQLWIAEDRYRQSGGRVLSTSMSAFGNYLRKADREAVAHVDVLVASCENVRRRIETIYDREADVVHPPVDLSAFYPEPVDRDADLVLLVGRLVEPYKQVSNALEAFARLPFRLVVVGDGRDARRLRAAAPPNVTFAGRARDHDLRRWYSRASVVLFPSEDDFGLVPVEAMACGTPVVALDAGGARETVLHDVTGLRYGSPDELGSALEEAMNRPWDREAIRGHASTFGSGIFIERMQAIVADALSGRASASVREIGSNV